MPSLRMLYKHEMAARIPCASQRIQLQPLFDTLDASVDANEVRLHFAHVDCGHSFNFNC